jgi:uncharacterized membrane protein YdfJ with MMPL/SSD domain
MGSATSYYLPARTKFASGEHHTLAHMIATVRALAQYAYFWKGRLLLVAIAVTLAAAIGSSSVFDRVKPFGFQDPASDSSRVNDRLEAVTGQRVLPDILLLVDSGRQTSDELRAAAELRSIPEVTRTLTPAENPRLIAEDGKSALVLGFLDADTEDVPAVGEVVQDRFAGDPAIAVGGTAVTAYELNQTTEDDLGRIELFAAPILLLLSLFVFRGFVAALLPLAAGGVSILTTLFLLGLLTRWVDIDVFAINIVTGLGLGLAIDYSLFLVTRFRDRLERGDSVVDALIFMMETTGRMVVFSGLTVAVAMLSLCVFPQRFLYSIGLGGAIVAVSSAVVCLVVLPALLALLQHRVNALAPGWMQRRPGARGWREFGGVALRHPAIVAVTVVAVMVVAGLPFLRVELTRADARVLPEDASARWVDRAVQDRFPSDPATGIVVTVETADRSAARSAARILADNRAVDRVAAPARLSKGLVRVDASLTGDPFSDASVDAVEEARSLDWGGPALVGGPSAELSDQRDSLAAHLPVAIAFIVVSTALILFAMTKSVILPLVALAMNALTVSVAFGVLVVVFQDGRLEDALDFTSQGALDSSMPILLFAVAFGLSTDYGVFALQAVAEGRRETTDEARAVALGLGRTGGQIIAAALLFAVAMGAFAFSELVYVKEVAVGTAVAVLVDATLVRGLLLPAVLKLLGPWAWWAPEWLRRPAERPVS